MQNRCSCKHLWVPGYHEPSGVTAYRWAPSGGPSAPLMQNRPRCRRRSRVLTNSRQSARHRKQRTERTCSACSFSIKLIHSTFKLFKSNVRAVLQPVNGWFMSNWGHRGRCFLWWKIQMVRDLCGSSSDCAPEFSGVFIFFGVSRGLFCALTKEKLCAKNMSLIFYESAAEFPSGFSLW